MESSHVLLYCLAGDVKRLPSDVSEQRRTPPNRGCLIAAFEDAEAPWGWESTLDEVAALKIPFVAHVSGNYDWLPHVKVSHGDGQCYTADADSLWNPLVHATIERDDVTINPAQVDFHDHYWRAMAALGAYNRTDLMLMAEGTRIVRHVDGTPLSARVIGCQVAAVEYVRLAMAHVAFKVGDGRSEPPIIEIRRPSGDTIIVDVRDAALADHITKNMLPPLPTPGRKRIKR